MTGARTRLAVLGSPIGHSKSPALHAAAYRELGLDWTYEALDVDAAGLPGFLASLDGTWRGLSLTMPLKRDVLPLLDRTDETSRLTGGSNTVLFADSQPGHQSHGASSGFNTDVAGIVAAFADRGVTRLDSVQILGGGATAASVLVAARSLGVVRALVSVRSPENAAPLATIGRDLGMDVTIQDWRTPDHSPIAPDAIISTLPGGTLAPLAFPESVRASAVLFDVAYDPWPSVLASSWLDAGGTVVSGIRMLVHQALVQVRIFVGGDPGVELANEPAVLAAMFEAVGNDGAAHAVGQS